MKRHAEIAGAGIVGLTAAAALAQRGWSVRVHERGDELREIGAGIFLWQNALRALRGIGAFDEVTRRSQVHDAWELRDDRLRTVQQEWMFSADDPLHAVLRPDLLRGLAITAEKAGADIVLNSTVAGARADGTLILEDGSELKADLVIGADGVNSRVRESLGLTADYIDMRDGASRHLIPRTENDAEREILEYWRKGRRVGVVPCSPEHVYIYLACPAWDVEARAQNPDFREHWVESFPHLADVFERIDDDESWYSFKQVKCYRWSLGKAAVGGDAAHGMSPTLGQAACVAMHGAYALAEAVERYPNLSDALAAWETSERPVVDATQRFSRYYGYVNARWPAQLTDLRSAFVWSLGRSRRAQARINCAPQHTPDFSKTPVRPAPSKVAA
jgi:2-polyprenyl-6-methoxyphenol hydroxylase-like FAD-dependent oxidoreductase